MPRTKTTSKKPACSYPTIREIESKKLENINKSKEQVRQWGLYKYPTPTKRIKSISQLRKKLDEFFELHPIDNKTKAMDLPTPTQLAVFLGYPSQSALFAEINNPIEPEYSAFLARAVDLIRDALLKKQMGIAERAGKWDGIDAALSRMERIEEKTMPESDSKSAINIQINLNAREKTKNLVNESIASLRSDLTSSNQTPVDTSFEEIE